VPCVRVTRYIIVRKKAAAIIALLKVSILGQLTAMLSAEMESTTSKLPLSDDVGCRISNHVWWLERKVPWIECQEKAVGTGCVLKVDRFAMNGMISNVDL
jgi:hypothetical protein